MSLNPRNLLGLCVAGATLASSAVVFSASPTQAATFTVNGTDYDITTVYGSYDSLKTQLEATPWWGNGSLGFQVATAVGNELGWYSPAYARYAEGGPLFAYGVGPVGWIGENIYSLYKVDPVDWRVEDVIGIDTTQWYPHVYAVGSAVGSAAVPEPLTILGSITAAGFGVAFKRKKNSTKEE